MRSARAARWAGVGLVAIVAGSTSVHGEIARRGVDDSETIARAQRQEALRRVESDRPAYAASVAARWEESARDAGRWDASFPSDLAGALATLPPESLLAAGEAPSFKEMMAVVATGRVPASAEGAEPSSLGDPQDDLVYTPVAPCRLVDTRLARDGALLGGAARTFDVDGGSFAGQGGSATGCGIPFAVAAAVTMTIVAVEPAAPGYLTAWGLGPQPTSSVLNYAAKDVIANTAIVPVAPGGGNDFALFSLATTHVVVDVLGYYARPIATRLECTNVVSDVVSVPVDVWTPVDAFCSPGWRATGGGYDTSESPSRFRGVSVTSVNQLNGWRTWVDNQTDGPREIVTTVRCCRVPGR
jgi:hypothetical protein